MSPAMKLRGEQGRVGLREWALKLVGGGRHGPGCAAGLLGLGMRTRQGVRRAGRTMDGKTVRSLDSWALELAAKPDRGLVPGLKLVPLKES